MSNNVFLRYHLSLFLIFLILLTLESNMPSGKSKSDESAGRIFGVDDGAIDRSSLTVPVHRGIVKPFNALRAEALLNGYDLAIASGYRDFNRQLVIWNEKVEGLRTVYDSNEQPIDMSILTPWQQVQAILRWSALPGTSRHHWGTDIDIYDRAALSAADTVQLSVAEVSKGGPFWPLHQWLDRVLATADSDFFRPYCGDNNEVAPERWHLSYQPLASAYQAGVSEANLREFLSDKPIALKSTVLENLEEIYYRFIYLST